jgi:hypothetical protein
MLNAKSTAPWTHLIGDAGRLRRYDSWPVGAKAQTHKASASIEYHSEGKRRSLRLGDIANAEIEGLPGQDGSDVTIAGQPFTAVPGFPAVVAKSKQARFSDYGLRWEVSNKNGFFSQFAYQSA